MYTVLNSHAYSIYGHHMEGYPLKFEILYSHPQSACVTVFCVFKLDTASFKEYRIVKISLQIFLNILTKSKS